MADILEPPSLVGESFTEWVELVGAGTVFAVCDQTGETMHTFDNGLIIAEADNVITGVLYQPASSIRAAVVGMTHTLLTKASD